MHIHGRIHLKPREERRLLKGHLWVFSNEIAGIDVPPDCHHGFVDIFGSAGQELGTGYWNRHSLIAARLLSRTRITDLPSFLRLRLHAAARRREAIGYQGAYRLCFGESDALPGIVIDRYGDAAVIESFTAGADALVAPAADVLTTDLGCRTVIERSESVWRTREGSETRSRILAGSAGIVEVDIEGITYGIDLADGQKTGFFLDQRENRLRAARHAGGRRVLDLFCNDGGFALHAARAGAVHVDAVDASAAAVARARDNAARNGLTQVDVRCADVFELLAQRSGDERYGLVIVDPPSFVKSARTLATGLKGYRKLNEAALRAVEDGGVIATCSCSQHVDEAAFLRMLDEAARRAGCTLRVIDVSGAAKDHPVLLAMPETRYLCCVTALVERQPG